MEREWDDARAAANLAKHSIDLLDAIGALTDPRRIEDVDDRFDNGEEGTVMLVATTMHGEDLCRIVSARRATRNEQDQ